ncbi:ankyrin repeat domain-containing protein [Acerihabitans sp. TG2]|uniref:ankyrin repeat domain-containing protein n=1 Tax=Acerihabitans sp. TG2 TaxID=3096008 RepID=UPI002B227526|nr:ankyrin repeat domain-containing protein [Acerihabitans sp. TG2]MEA9393255.1 ankyrin repeat domain-containing protein [Acerihabitans sp. TG2]
MDVNRNGSTPHLAIANPTYYPLSLPTQSETIIYSEERYGSIDSFEQNIDYHRYLQQMDHTLTAIIEKTGYIQGADDNNKKFIAQLSVPQSISVAIKMRCYTSLVNILHVFAQEPLHENNAAGLAILTKIVKSLDQPIETFIQRAFLYYIDFMGEMRGGIYALLYQAKQALTQSHLLCYLETAYGEVGSAVLTAFKRQLQDTGWDMTDEDVSDHCRAEILREAAMLAQALIQNLNQNITIGKIITYVGLVIYNDVNNSIYSLKNHSDNLFMQLFKDKAFKEHLAKEYPFFTLTELFQSFESFGPCALMQPINISIQLAEKLADDPQGMEIYAIQNGSENEMIRIRHLGDFFWLENKETQVKQPLDLIRLSLGNVILTLSDAEMIATIHNTPVHGPADSPHPVWFSDYAKIFYAIHKYDIFKATQVLINKKLINMCFTEGKTVLMTAIVNKRIDIVKQIVECEESDVNIQDDEGNSALHFAVDLNMDDVVDWLLTRYCNINVVNNNKITALHIAVTINSAVLVKKLIMQPTIAINRQDKAGNTPLILAVLSGNVDITADLLAHKDIDINEVDVKGWSPLHIAAYNGHVAMLTLLTQKSGLAINRLIGGRHKTPLMLAIEHGQELAVMLLIKHPEIDLNLSDYYGNSALMMAAAQSYIRIFDAILRQGKADVNAKNSHNESALSIAVKNRHFDQVLSLLKQADLDVNIVIHQGNTPLHIAAAAGDQRIIIELLKHPKIDANAKNHKGYSALTLAAINGHAAVIQAFQANGKANVNLIDNEEKTPLMYAVIYGYEAAVIALLTFDNIMAGYTNSRSKTALSLATFLNYRAIAKRLSAHPSVNHRAL